MNSEKKMGETELLVREHLNLTARGDLQAAEANVTSDYFNHRCADEPLDTRGRGPEAHKATVRWLHRAFTEMRFEFHEVLIVEDRAVARVTPMPDSTDLLSFTTHPTGASPMPFRPMDGVFQSCRLIGLGLLAVRLRNTTPFAMISEWPSNSDGFRRHLLT